MAAQRVCRARMIVRATNSAFAACTRCVAERGPAMPDTIFLPGGG